MARKLHIRKPGEIIQEREKDIFEYAKVIRDLKRRGRHTLLLHDGTIFLFRLFYCLRGKGIGL